MQEIDELEYDMSQAELTGSVSRGVLQSTQGLMVYVEPDWWFLSNEPLLDGSSCMNVYDKATNAGFSFRFSWNLGRGFRKYLRSRNITIIFTT